MDVKKKAERCISCGVPLTDVGDVSFYCPGCGKALIGRCHHCRDQSVLYVCPECGFEGP
ncbi:MAG: DUF1610 domain-containing protein [Thermoplasmata archaeon]|nr:DUF1610 domain-containing protein [Thermoplasmata archaeon]